MRIHASLMLILAATVALSCTSEFQKKVPIYKSKNIYVYTLADSVYPQDPVIRSQLKPVQAMPVNSADGLLNLLTWVRYEKGGFLGTENSYVYAPGQLREILPVIRDILKANPPGVRFILVTQYDRYRTVLSKMRRTTLMFWSDGESIHLVFGEINTELVGDDFSQEERWLDIFPVNLKRAPSETRIHENPAFTFGKMGDFTHPCWLVVPAASLVALKPDPDFGRTGPNDKPPPPGKGVPVEERLKKLDELKAKGLINDKEYETQRSRILSEI